MLSRDEHDAIISRLYAAAVGERDWHGALGAVADHFGHAAGVLVVFDPVQGAFRAQAHGKDDAFAHQFYHSETFRLDPRAAIHMTVQPGQLYHDRALYDVAAMMRDERVRRTIDEIGLAHQMGASLRLPNHASAMFTLLSTEAEGMPDDDAVLAFSRLAPHIEQAVAFGELLERGAATQEALVEALAARVDGVILLDSHGLPTFMNESASLILGLGDGLQWGAGGFTTRRGPETRRLCSLIHDAIAARTAPSSAVPGGQMLVTRPSGKRPYVLRVLPAPMRDRFMNAFSIACVVHIHDLAAVRVPSMDVLQGVFGLTGREAQLAIELVRHAGLAAAAAAIGMARNTARNHLHGIFYKCGVTSQAEAVQLFTRLA